MRVKVIIGKDRSHFDTRISMVIYNFRRKISINCDMNQELAMEFISLYYHISKPLRAKVTDGIISFRVIERL